MMDAQLIIRHFDLAGVEADKIYTESEIEALLAGQIAWMLEHRIDYLLSLMYRLDIDESKIASALQPGAALPPHEGLAKLVIERQKQRIETKAAYREQHPDYGSWE